MTDYTIVEKYQQNKSRSIAIRPFFNPDKQNMGLENYGMLFRSLLLDLCNLSLDYLLFLLSTRTIITFTSFTPLRKLTTGYGPRPLNKFLFRKYGWSI